MRTLPCLVVLSACASGEAGDEFRMFVRDAEVEPDARVADMRVADMPPVDAAPVVDAAPLDMTPDVGPECVEPADCPNMGDRCVNGMCFAPRDSDQDGVPDDADVCPDDYDPDQSDTDRDGHGNLCDACPTFADDGQVPCPADLPPCHDLAENVHLWTTYAANDEPTTIAFVPGVAGQAVRAQTEAGFEFYLQVRPAEQLPPITPDQVLLLSARGQNTNEPNWQGEFPEVRLVDVEDRERIIKPTQPRLSADNRWETFTIPISGNDAWLVQDGGADLTRIRALRVYADTWDSGFELALDGITFARAGQVCFGLAEGPHE